MRTEWPCIKDPTVLTKNGLYKKALHVLQGKDRFDFFSPQGWIFKKTKGEDLEIRALFWAWVTAQELGWSAVLRALPGKLKTSSVEQYCTSMVSMGEWLGSKLTAVGYLQSMGSQHILDFKLKVAHILP